MKEVFKDKRSLALSTVYMLLILLLKPELPLFFVFGGVIGFLFLPVLAEVLKFAGQKSVVESVLTQIPLSLLSFYAVSSSTSQFGQGFTLVLFLQTILRYRKSWFWPVKGGVSNLVSLVYSISMVIVFFYSSFLLL